LKEAYGELVGTIGNQLKGHMVECNRRTATASLAYGEMLPCGVAKALHRLGVLPAPSRASLPTKSPEMGDQCTTGHEHLECSVSQGGPFLELGMGIGMVALQIFLQCPDVTHVIGIELSQSRFDIGRAALHRLVERHPENFQLRSAAVASFDQPADICESSLLDSVVLQDLRCCSKVSRTLEFRQGDFLEESVLSTEEIKSAAAVMMQLVQLDPFLYQQRLQHAHTGCRLLSLGDIRRTWCLNEPSLFHYLPAGANDLPQQLQEIDNDSNSFSNSNGQDLFSVSWNEKGVEFFVFVADSDRKATITKATAASAAHL